MTNDNAGNNNLIRAGVLLEAGTITLEDAAAAAGKSDTEFLDAMTPEVMQEIAVEYFKHRLTGRLSESRAMLGLDKLSVKLLADADDPELTTAQALRIGDFLLRLSGMVEKRQAEIKAEPTRSHVGILLVQHQPHLRYAMVYPNDPKYEQVEKLKTTQGEDAAFAYLDQHNAGDGDA